MLQCSDVLLKGEEEVDESAEDLTDESQMQLVSALSKAVTVNGNKVIDLT